MDALDELLAKERIRTLAMRYALAVDGKDIEGIAALFVDDVHNGRYGPGREGVKAFYDAGLRGFHCSMHLIANHVIDFDDDDHAHGTVYCRAQHHVSEPDHWYDKALCYWDSYERVHGVWYFRRRKLRSWYRQEFGHPGHGTQRIESVAAKDGPERGARMPDAFPTFGPFWDREPFGLPESVEVPQAP